MKIKQYTVNAIGLSQIAGWLGYNHKRAVMHGQAAFFSEDMLRAWAADAEFQMGEGNPPSIELKACDSVTGCTQEFTLSDVCIDVTEIEIPD